MPNRFVVQSLIVGHFGLPPNVNAIVRALDSAGAPAFVAQISSEHGADGRALHTTLDVQIEAGSLDEAWQLGYHYGAFFAPLMALSANAPFGSVETTRAVSLAPGRRDRVLRIAYTVSPESHWFDRSREVPVKEFIEASEALFTSEHSGRLHRAMVHYADALASWSAAESLRSVYSLFHAVELLSEVVTKRALETLAAADLAARWEVAGSVCSSCGDRQVTDGHLRAGARGAVVLQGDGAATKAWRDVRNALAHGYGDFPSMQRVAEAIRPRLAELVRESILDELRLDPEVRTGLLAPPLSTPLPREAFRNTFETLMECDADGIWSQDEGWIATDVEVLVGAMTYGPDGSIAGDGPQVRVTTESPRGGGALKGVGSGGTPGAQPTGDFSLTLRRADGSTEQLDSSQPDWRTVEFFDVDDDAGTSDS